MLKIIKNIWNCCTMNKNTIIISKYLIKVLIHIFEKIIEISIFSICKVLQIYFYKMMNNWKFSKQRLDIVQRTKNHQRHLMNLINVKSQIDDRNNSTTNGFKTYKSKCITNRSCAENNNSIDKSRKSVSQSQHDRKFINLTNRIQNVCTIQRSMKNKQINKQNERFLERLVNINPTINRNSWLNSSKSIEKYKTNLSRSKYIQPDYTQQVSRCIKRKQTLKHLHINSLGNLRSLRSELKR